MNARENQRELPTWRTLHLELEPCHFQLLNMTERPQRRLAAIIAADVAEYSRLMRVDEEATMEAWWSYRREVIDPIVANHGGRVVKLTGDGFLAEFISATDAVSAAIAMQSEIASRISGMDNNKRVQFRMGINLGDILWDEDDIYGDGVNIAARIEGLADPGGILVSASVHDQVHHRLSANFEDLGEQVLKNIDVPQRIYRVDRAAHRNSANSSTKDRLSVPDRPSVAVLPFENKSGDPDQTYFSDGLTENIVTGLTRFREILVTGMKSILVVREQASDLREISRVLGVAHIVEGSVLKVGNRVRVTVRLVDSATGQNLWAEKYDRDLHDVFAVQDEITSVIVTTLASQIENLEVRRAANKPIDDLIAYDFVLRGRQCLNRYTKEGDLEARHCFEKAIELEPDYVPAYAGLSISFIHEYEANWTESPDDALEQAYKFAQKAVALDAADSAARYAISSACFYRGQQELAEAHIEKALEQNPNDYHNLCNKGYFLACSNRSSDSFAFNYEAMRLNPLVPDNCLFAIAIAEYNAGRYEDALVALGKTRGWGLLRPGFIAACYAQLGRNEQAQLSADEVRKLAPGDPSTPNEDDTERWRLYWSRIVKFQNPEDQARYFEGLRKAGLPA